MTALTPNIAGHQDLSQFALALSMSRLGMAAV
ncbi:MAG: hypothetical protein CM1200mP18_19520 [Gammaproteobacteria bacterium]|nr:MAG: hypothetical protein CM1200mP18_19520 [Gammaproteobacteria bacterium]